MIQMGEEPFLTCPGCMVGELKINTEEMAIPHFGTVVISSLICSSCGYRSIDVMPVENRPPSRYMVEIRSKRDLDIRVIRSSTSTLRIPELGITIQPGSAHEGYITNIEGVLSRVHGILLQVERDLTNRSEEFLDIQERMKRASDLMKRIEIAMDGYIEEDGSFSVILEDPQGNSAMISEDGKVIEQELTEEEILELTRGMY